MEENTKRDNYTLRVVSILIYTSLKVVSIPVLSYQVFTDFIQVSKAGVVPLKEQNLTQLMPYRSLIVNQVLNLVITIDILCYTCSGFEFLHNYGGLCMFYILAAIFNTTKDTKN